MGEYRERVTGQAQDFVRGSFTGKVYPPVEKDRGWVVAIADVLGERLEKKFASKSRALDFYTEVWLGISRTEQAVKASGGALPGLETTETAGFKRPQLADMAASGAQAGHQARLKLRKAINLRKVAEVLESYGLDPTETIADALVPVVTIDPDTGVEMDEHRLSTEQRAHIALELMQYLHPKLKAVEMKIDGTLAGMTQERLDARLQLLLARAAKGDLGGK